MKIMTTALIVLVANLAIAKPTVISVQHTENIVACQQAAGLYKAFRDDLTAVGQIRLQRDMARDNPHLKGTFSSYLGIAELSLGKNTAAVVKLDSEKIIVATVSLDSEKIILLNLLSPTQGEGKISISPSHVKGNALVVPAQTVEISFSGARFCSAITKRNGDVNAATVELVDQLFTK